MVSLTYTILTFTTNDRLSGKSRRVILPAHIVQSLWYLCVTASRVIALAVFAYAYGYWVYVAVAGHWILMFLFLVIQRTSFCADVELQPSEDGRPPKQTIRRRWSLEIPFYFVAATVYIFTYFNMKHGRSWYLLTPFHILMFAENVTMGVLYYIRFSSLTYAPAVLTVVAGLYPVGMFFMVIFYCLCHPGRTKDWYWVGIPRKISCCSCCSCCSANKEEGEEMTGFRNRSSIVISGPTLISHNGFLPNNMIPVGVSTSPPPEGITREVDTGTARQRSTMAGEIRVGTDDVAARLSQRQQPRNQISSLAIVSPNPASEENTGRRSVITPTESSRSNPVFSDVPSQFLPSELDTDVDSNVMHGEGEHVDTVIDTPLAGFTPEPFDLNMVHMLQRDGRTKSIESQRADTIDTGIDVSSVAGLTPGTTGTTNGGSRPEDTNHHPFVDIPAKRKNYLTERSKLEQHYFPEDKSQHQRNRDSGSVTPTLPTPNWSQSPASNSPHSGRVTWGHQTSDSSPERQRRNVTPGTVSSQSQQQSPSRSKRNNNGQPRSPKGARAFSVDEQVDGRLLSSYEKRQIAPRSPKGAKRLMISAQQHPGSSAAGAPFTTQHQQQRHSSSGQSSERGGGYYPPSPHRSPARLPRGAHVYPHSSPERTRERLHSSPERAHNRGGGGGGMPTHIVPQRAANNQGYPAHMSPARLPKGPVVPSYQAQRVDGDQRAESHWDSWTAENTHINAAQAVATTQLRMEGSIGGGVPGANAVARLHSKEMSPSSRSENAAEVERHRSFNVERRAPKANPYYSPYVPKRINVDVPPHVSNYPPQLRRPTATKPIPVNYQQHFSRHSGEYNPQFSTEVDGGNRTHLHPGSWRMSESYPSPMASGPMAQMSPRYPRTPQGAAAKAPRMARSPPEKRLKSMSPQRSIHSYGGGGWEGGAGGGASTSSRPNSLHSNNSAFTPHQPAARHSDGASAVAWASANAQWSGRRSPRLNPVLHVPRSSTHESAV